MSDAAWTIAVLMICMLVSPTYAQHTQIYRCELPSGVVSFSDRYCGDDARAVILTVPPTSGVVLGSTGDFTAIERGNAKRASQRNARSLRRQQERLFASHKQAVAALEQRIAQLPENAFKASTAQRLSREIEALQTAYTEAQTRLRVGSQAR